MTWLTLDNDDEYLIKDGPKPFENPEVSYDQGLWTINFRREFDPDFGSKWEKGQTKQIVIGVNFRPKEHSWNNEVLGHSHKHEMRLGNEIWSSSKKKGFFDRKLHSADIAL